MANSRSGTALFFDTTASFDGAVTIEAVKYIGNASGTVVISTAAGPIWQDGGTTNLSSDYICARCDSGFTVTITNGAKVYVYLEND